MKERREVEGQIFSHDKGLGTVTRQMIEERAREIAVIDGRTRVNKEDRLQARRDLLRMRGMESEAEELEAELDSLDPSETRAEHGHQAPNFEPDDEEQVPYELVEKGVDEADHEQMLQGHLQSEEEEEQEESREGGRVPEDRPKRSDSDEKGRKAS